LLALLANGVFSIEHSLRAADAGLAVGDPAASRVPAPSGFAERLAESMLATADDRALRNVLRTLPAARDPNLATGIALRRRAIAEAELAALTQQGSPAQRSQAANLLGVLAFEDAELDPSHAKRYLDTSVGALKGAVQLDSRNEEAKYNLELLLTLASGKQKP